MILLYIIAVDYIEGEMYMEMKRVYDIFCDASVGSDLRGSCYGCEAVDRMTGSSMFNAVIQPDGTNNSGEMAAISLGVKTAVNIKHANILNPPIFNIFSDSLICINSIRSWIFSWVKYMRNNILYKPSGEEVLNQGYLKLIFNTILIYRPDIRFYHQKGHINAKNINIVEPKFRASNFMPLSNLGISPEYISKYNNDVDRKTREIIFRYLETNGDDSSGCLIDVNRHGIRDLAMINEPDSMNTYAGLIHTDEFIPRRTIANH